MTDARSELPRLKVPELKHFLKGKRIPYTEKRTEEFVLLDERTESWEEVIINKFPDRYSALPLQWTGTGTTATGSNQAPLGYTSTTSTLLLLVL